MAVIQLELGSRMSEGREKRISEINSRLSQLEREKQQLLDELKSLKVVDAAMKIYGTPTSQTPPTSPESRIELFSKLFRCRKDVYPRLWENAAKSTSGYSPVCKNEWIRSVCHEPKVKCTVCLNRDFVPLDESAIRNHLMGKMTI